MLLGNIYLLLLKNSKGWYIFIYNKFWKNMKEDITIFQKLKTKQKQGKKKKAQLWKPFSFFPVRGWAFISYNSWGQSDLICHQQWSKPMRRVTVNGKQTAHKNDWCLFGTSLIEISLMAAYQILEPKYWMKSTRKLGANVLGKKKNFIIISSNYLDLIREKNVISLKK